MKIIQLNPQTSGRDKQILLPAFLQIWNTPENQKFLSYTQRPLDKTLVEAWLREHQARGNQFFAGVNDNNDILGILITQANVVDGFEIYGIAVRPEVKGQGIGRRLIQYAVNLAIAQGYQSLQTLVFADNIRMLRLLLSLNFIPVEMQFNKRADGADTLLLRKRLQN